MPPPAAPNLMRIVDGNGVGPDDRQSHAAIGNFDGVHRGHQAVIATAAAAARQAGGPLSVITFEPHPKQFFAREDADFRLTPPEVKQHRLEKLGVDILFTFQFDSDLANMSAEEFAGAVLGDRLGLASIAAGSDFRFGHRRQGDLAALRAAGAEAGYEVHEVTKAGANERPYSSSAIREALRTGDPAEAARQLGFWHRIEGEVIAGERRGHELNMPTANLPIEGICQPAFGVYAVDVEVIDGPHAGEYRGVANLGISPMFDRKVAQLETYIFDFDGELYGARISVGLCAYLRPEGTFDSVDELASQMQRDASDARQLLESVQPPWGVTAS